MVARPKIDRQVMRAHNRSVVLDVVRRSGPVARTEVARRTSLAKPTVSAIVDELLAEGVVHEVGVGKSTAAGGRPPTYLDFDVTRDAYVGVHLGVDTTTVAVADGRGTVVAERSRRSAIGSPARSLQHVAELFDDALRSAKVSRTTVRHATIALPGLVDRDSGVCVLAPNLRWHDVPVEKMFGDELGVPVTVWNTPHASAVAEARIGAARDVDTFVWLYVGPGVGSAIVQDGELVTGTRGFAGEVGDCRVADDGPQCLCGKFGCLEVYTSGEAISRAAATAAVPSRTKAPRLPDVVAAARHGHDGARRVLEDAGHMLGLGTSYLVGILNPELVVVGGESAPAFDFLLKPLRGALAQDALEAEQVPVVASAVEGDAAVAGAVLLAFEAGIAAEAVEG
jgi:predicted NBD/HSP70 family sugar kinase